MDQGKGKRITKKLKAYGIVQGVGFRPLVYRIARSLNILGYVRNVGGYVEIIAQAEESELNRFVEEMMKEQSGGCEIIKLESQEYSEEGLTDFKIVNSERSGDTSIIVPDLPICANCGKELLDDTNRRHQNPFISCISCGPRYTIMEELPYDRQTTTMKDFEMCSHCQEEYTSSDSRRFHAQTISCNDCGPYLIYRDRHGEECDRNEAFDKAVSVIEQGDIIAVKGVGGYHFVCSPYMEEAVQRLRRLKGREEKPFAVMFPSIEKIKEYCKVSPEEEALLKTAARPIVLLHMHNNAFTASVVKDSVYCGAFLPYTPLQLLLMNRCGPLIMTSANVSDQPVIKEEEKLFDIKSPYLTGILYNKRRIVRSVDDSVARIIDGKPQLIRRSRGYVPYPVFINWKEPDQVLLTNNSLFAAGGDLKAAFCLYKAGRAVVSQYFGDLANTGVMEEYQRSYSDLCKLLKLKPEFAVCELHPDYSSVRFTKALKLPFVQVQHHHAHIASVIAEHELQGRVIGVSFDGTGYGTDGNVWGGEFLICEEAHFIRAAHLTYHKILGGDSSMRDAKKTASCYLIHSNCQDFIIDDRLDIIKAALEHDVNTILTSSMGRLFDAVAAILGLGQENRFEGECAALLEKEAVIAIRNCISPYELSFAFSQKDEIIEIDPKPLLREICQAKGKITTKALALGFHYAVADMIALICDKLKEIYRTNTVALSGGVFQNYILTERSLKLLREKGFHAYMNMAVPPNDGGISLGQSYLGQLIYKEGLKQGLQ